MFVAKLVAPAALAAVLCAVPSLGPALGPTPGPAPLPAAPQDAPGDASLEEMLAQAAKYMNPGAEHAELERFLGRWDVEMTILMGGKPYATSKGTCTYGWLIEGRWIQGRLEGELMGQPYTSVSTLGYDNFKKSFIVSVVNSMDTAMLYFEGDLTQRKDALIVYGTLDEYTDGQHDKMVKTVFRFRSPDEIVMEVHDLPIGEENTKVIEFRSTRAKD